MVGSLTVQKQKSDMAPQPQHSTPWRGRPAPNDVVGEQWPGLSGTPPLS